MHQLIYKLVLLITLLPRAKPASDKRPSQYKTDNYYSLYERQIDPMGLPPFPYPENPPSNPEYESDWGSPDWGMGHFTRPQCMTIPSNLSLCYNIGYDTMRVPNLLEHETVSEIIQQSAIWNSLAAINCHPDTRMFLCSLFAPICIDLDRPILPCRTLCQAVRQGCESRMMERGFPWPDILKCDNFPLSNGMCVDVQHVETSGEASCPPCNSPKTFVAVMDSYCSGDTMFKVKIRKSERKGSDIVLKTGRKKKFYKKGASIGSLKKNDIRAMDILVKDATKCKCELNLKNDFLVSGQAKDGKFLPRFMHEFDHGNADIKQALRKIRKDSDFCEKQGLEMLNAEDSPPKKPENRDITTNDRPAAPVKTICDACKLHDNFTAMRENGCRSSLIVLVQLKGLQRDGPRIRLTSGRKKTVLRHSSQTTANETLTTLLQTLDVSVSDAKPDCVCELNYQQKSLVFGDMKRGQLFANAIFDYDQTDGRVAAFVRAIRGGENLCEAQGTRSS